MRTGLFDDLQEIVDSCKTAVIDHELKRLNIDVTALQETRLPGRGISKGRTLRLLLSRKSR